MGDVHALGNPHYWLDPANGRRIAQAVAKKLGELDPAAADYYQQRFASFDVRLADAERRWTAAMAPYRGTEIVTYHRSWSNFAERFGLHVAGFVEPKPGIPPSTAHTHELVEHMKHRRIGVVIVEPYFDVRTPAAIARQTAARVVVLSPSVGGVKEAVDYLSLFDHIVGTLIAALGPSHDHHDHAHDPRR
jgi:ABC-type Zn uptake system ZnuABC Zn-binding protein ZnuA